MDNTNPPVVTARPSVVPILERINLSDMFTVTDRDLDFRITRYRFRDNGVGGGNFLLGEQIVQANAFTEIAASQFPSVSYRGGTSFGTETFTVQAYDGRFWSNFSTNSITTGNVSPELTTRPGRVSANDRIRIDQFISYADGDNDPAVRYMIVDRNNNFGGGNFVDDTGARIQARWFTVEARDLPRLFYEGADNGTETETISVQVWDGFSWSPQADFTMSTTTEPIVNPTTEAVLVDQRRSAVAFFTTQDNDNDPIFSYTVADYRINPDGGYWEFKGDRMPSAQFFTVLATELNQLFYVGGSTGPQSEVVGVQVFDGFQFSEITNFEIRTVTAPEVSGRDIEVQRGHFINMATGQTKNELNGELSPTGNPILDFMDADGDEIESFLFNDLSMNSNGGHFVFKDNRIESAKFFRVQANELDQLFYRAGEFGPQAENIRVIAFSNGVSSEQATFNAATLQNQFAPDLQMFNVTARAGVLQQLSGFFTVADRDLDAIETFSFFDTGDDPNSGFFTVNNVPVPAKQWITLNWDQLPTVKYQLSSLANTENVRMRVSDGRLTSTIQSSTVVSVAAPVIDATVNDISVDGIERIPASSLITQVDSGPSFTQYQVYDENTFFRSGRLELDTVDLQQGVVHTLTAAEFSRLQFKGAEQDFGRQFDPMLVRADNGVTGWTEWERINVNTDPVGNVALATGTQWIDPRQPDKTVVEYMFIDGNPGPFPPMPTYYVCRPAQNPNEECNEADDERALNQPQRETIREVIEYYERTANIDFVEVEYTPDAGNAAIIFGSDNPNPTLPPRRGTTVQYQGGHVDLPNGLVFNGYADYAGDVWFDRAQFDPLTNFEVGLGSEFRRAAFELVGASVGFGNPDTLPLALSIFMDFEYNTIMSDIGTNVFDPIATPHPEVPSSGQLYDVVELQRLYGVNTDWNTNNNHYGNFFSGSYPHFINNDETHQTTLYDAGGTDTLNYSNHVADENIDLRQGAWSTINGVPLSLRIAYLTEIENARGGSGNDTIRGTEVRNLLFGNRGNDVLRGGGDDDVLRGGEGDDTYQWSLGDGRDNVREEGNGGVDIVEFYDPSGSIDSLEDDFTVRRFGNELRIDLTLDQGEGQGTVSVVDMGVAGSEVELMRIHGLLGAQIGGDIDLLSLYNIATSSPGRYRVTEDIGQNGGFIVAPA
jgi:hypothetical protein